MPPRGQTAATGGAGASQLVAAAQGNPTAADPSAVAMPPQFEPMIGREPTAAEKAVEETHLAYLQALSEQRDAVAKVAAGLGGSQIISKMVGSPVQVTGIFGTDIPIPPGASDRRRARIELMNIRNRKVSISPKGVVASAILGKFGIGLIGAGVYLTKKTADVVNAKAAYNIALDRLGAEVFDETLTNAFAAIGYPIVTEPLVADSGKRGGQAKPAEVGAENPDGTARVIMPPVWGRDP